MLTLLELLAVMSTGLLAGALLTEALVLVPYWKRMAPSEFLRLHSTLAPTLFRFFAPLTVAGTLLPVIACSTASVSNGFSIAWSISAAAAVTILAFYFLFFRRANITFAETDDVDRAAVTLDTWSRLHHLRTLVAALGFLAATMGYAH